MSEPEKIEKNFAISSTNRGIAYGYAMMSTESDGSDHFDSYGDNIPQDEIVKASIDFMENSRVAKDMHDGDAVGSVAFAMILDDEIREAIAKTSGEGLFIGMQLPDELYEKAKSRERTGFSIGGVAKRESAT